MLKRGALKQSWEITPTCQLSGVAMETRHHNKAEQKSPPPLHVGTTRVSLLLQHKHKKEKDVEDHLEGGLSAAAEMDSSFDQVGRLPAPSYPVWVKHVNDPGEDPELPHSLEAPLNHTSSFEMHFV